MTRAARTSPGRALSTLAPEVSRIPIPRRAPAPMNYPLIATGNANAGRPSSPAQARPDIAIDASALLRRTLSARSLRLSVHATIKRRVSLSLLTAHSARGIVLALPASRLQRAAPRGIGGARSTLSSRPQLLRSAPTGSTQRQRATFAKARQRGARVSPRAAALSLLASPGPRSHDRHSSRRPGNGEPSRRVRLVDRPSAPANPRSPTSATTFTTRRAAALGRGRATLLRGCTLSTSALTIARWRAARVRGSVTRECASVRSLTCGARGAAATRVRDRRALASDTLVSSRSLLIRAIQSTATKTRAEIRSAPMMLPQRHLPAARVHSSAGRSTWAAAAAGLRRRSRWRGPSRNRVVRVVRSRLQCRARDPLRARVRRAERREATRAAGSARLETKPNAESYIAARLPATSPARRRPRTRVRRRQRCDLRDAALQATEVNWTLSTNPNASSAFDRNHRRPLVTRADSRPLRTGAPDAARRLRRGRELRRVHDRPRTRVRWQLDQRA